MSQSTPSSPPASAAAGNGTARPRGGKSTSVAPDLPPAHNFAALRRRDAIIRRTKKGADIMEAVLGGASLAEISSKTGHCLVRLGDPARAGAFWAPSIDD